MTLQGHKIGQILKLIYLRQYLSYSVDQSSKCRNCSWLSFWYIQLPVKLPVKKFVGLNIAAILKILKYQTQLQFDLRYEKIVPNYAKKSFL